MRSKHTRPRQTDSPSLAVSNAGHLRLTNLVPFHGHDGMELVYVVDGHCSSEAGGVIVEAFAGDMMVLPDGVPHNQLNYEPTETAYVAFRGFEGIFTDRPRAIEMTNPRPLQWLDDLIDAFKGTCPLSTACQSALAMALLNALCDIERGPSPQHPAVDAAITHMRQELHDPSLSLDALAEAAGVSGSHLSLLFRQELRCPPMRMLERLRMDRARQMLSAPYEPVKAVAAACGYNDASYFCRAFRRHTGHSPGEFRRTHQQHGRSPIPSGGK